MRPVITLHFRCIQRLPQLDIKLWRDLGDKFQGIGIAIWHRIAANAVDRLYEANTQDTI